MKQERFDKIIATQFNISRREARIAIRRGKATVCGKYCVTSVRLSTQTPTLPLTDKHLLIKGLFIF